MKTKDAAGNIDQSPATRDFVVDTAPPTAPGIVPSGTGCAGIENNQWQNSCYDRAFTLNAVDVGSGVKGYTYYWGNISNGTPSTWTTSSNFDPPAFSSPGSLAVRYLNVTARDNLDHDSGLGTFAVLFDDADPLLTVQINGGAASANQVNVTLKLSASDAGSGLAEVRLSSNNTDWSAWQPYVTNVPWTLPTLNRRTATVYAQVRDRAGNLSSTATASIYLDLYPPMPNSASYRICQDVLNVGGSTRITSTNYLLASAIGQPMASGATSATSSSFKGQSGFLSNLTSCLPITYTVTSNYTLTQWVVASAGNIRGSTNYRLGDTAGQAAASGAALFSSATYRLSSGFWAAITTTIPITTIPPTPVPTLTPTPTPTPGPTATPQPTSFGVTLNDGALYTNSPQVTVQAWGPNVTQMLLSNDGGFAGASWANYQLTSTWVISTYGQMSMPYFVFVRFRDAGNVEYGTYFDSIIYDPVPPQGAVWAMPQGPTTYLVETSASDDNSGVDAMRFGSSGESIGTEAWLSYDTLATYELASGNIVYAQFRDKAWQSLAHLHQRWHRV